MPLIRALNWTAVTYSSEELRLALCFVLLSRIWETFSDQLTDFLVDKETLLNLIIFDFLLVYSVILPTIYNTPNFPSWKEVHPSNWVHYIELFKICFGNYHLTKHLYERNASIFVYNGLWLLGNRVASGYVRIKSVHDDSLRLQNILTPTTSAYSQGKDQL